METFAESKHKIIIEITSDDGEVRDSYLGRYSKQIESFGDGMANAILAWRDLDVGSEQDADRAYVSAMIYCAITLHIQSMRLFLSGHIIGAGNLYRQTIEAISLALLCSSKQLTVLHRFREDKYSSSKAVRDLLSKCNQLGIRKDRVEVLKEQWKFFHKYSHPTKLTIAATMSDTGEVYVGACFDDNKIAEYDQEVSDRVSLAGVFEKYVDAVKKNVAEW